MFRLVRAIRHHCYPFVIEAFSVNFASSASGLKRMALQPDGYLGFVVAPAPMVRALVKGINIKHKAVYSKEAMASGATVEEMALRSGCRLIAERTAAGEKYQTPSGQWKTRDGSAPELDPRCPCS
jgi:uncharacterized protein YdbL (DUF1318 family)